MTTEYNQLVPPHKDGSVIFEEEANEYINALPINEEFKSMVPIQLDCSIEEYCQRTSAVSMDDFNDMVEQYEPRT